MLRSIFVVLFLTSMIAGCSVPEPPRDDGGAGSCVRNDPSAPGMTICSQSDISDGASEFCAGGGGSWVTAPCDPRKYARHCTSKGQMSVNNGPLTTVTETTFFQSGSQIICTD